MGRYKDTSTGTWKKEYAMPIGDTLPIGSEVDYDGSVVPYGWEEVEVEDNHAKIVYKSKMMSGQSDTYSFTEDGLYLLVAHTNGGNSCIMDIIMIAGGGLNTSRIKDQTTSYKSVTYSASVGNLSVTMNNTQYTGMYSITKLY